MTKRSSVDIVVPIFNEEAAIQELVSRIRSTLDSIPQIRWRLLLVENGSTDASHERIQHEISLDSRIIEIRLLRNFGMEGGLIAGLSVSDADATIMMQGDLEDPPELTTAFIERWLEGNDVVVGIIAQRKGHRFWRRMLTRLFYSLASFLTDGLVRKNASDFRLISRRVREFLLSSTDQNLFLRSLVMWPSSKVQAVSFTRDSRHSGQSKFKAVRTILWSAVGLLGQSVKPLRLITLLGFVAFVTSSLGLGVLIWRALLYSVPFAGFGTIVGFQLLFFGILMLALGVVSEYVAMIHREVRPRPKFIIEQVLNHDNSHEH